MNLIELSNNKFDYETELKGIEFYNSIKPKHKALITSGFLPKGLYIKDIFDTKINGKPFSYHVPRILDSIYKIYPKIKEKVIITPNKILSIWEDEETSLIKLVSIQCYDILFELPILTFKSALTFYIKPENESDELFLVLLLYNGYLSHKVYDNYVR